MNACQLSPGVNACQLQESNLFSQLIKGTYYVKNKHVPCKRVLI